MNNYAHRHHHKSRAFSRLKFYKHLKVYLTFIGVMLFLTFFMHARIDFYPIAFWWGLGVAFHYLKTFGWQHLNAEFTTFEEPKEQRTESFAEPEDEVFVELKQPQKAWRDRDLV